jgi:ElaB/YqjD/DUF883 family membrane-anchored ribosome-binding protein
MSGPVPPTGAPVPPTTSRPETSTADDPAVIRRDIDRTRGDREDTIDAINDRVNPRRIRDRRTNRMRRYWSSVRESVMGSSGYDRSSFRDRTPDVGGRVDQVREATSARADQARQALSDTPETVQRQTRGNPLTAGMIAFGVGTLIGSALPDSDAERRAVRRATDHVDVEGAKQRLSEHAHEVQSGVQDKAREAAEDLKGSARDAAQDVKDHAQHEGQRVKEDARQSGQQVRRQA